jgi:tetratricopeptide (TPR) repeat protein
MGWRWAVERNRQAQIEQSLESLFRFYEIQGWFLEGAEAFQRAAAMLEPECALMETSSEGTIVPASCLLYGRVLYRQAWFQTRLGLYEQVEEQFQKSLWLLRQGGARLRREVASCSIYFGTSFTIKREHAKAVSPLQESLALYNELGDPWGSGLALASLGIAAIGLGQFEEAEQVSQESLIRFSQIGERRTHIFAMNNLARLATLQGNYPQAERWHLEQLKLRADLDDRTGMAFTLNCLGETARLQDRPDQARQYYQQSLTLAKEIGLRSTQCYALWGLGNLAERLGHYAEAKRFFQESSTISKRNWRSEYNPAGPGWAYLGLGELQEAMIYFRDSLDFALRNQVAPLALDALTGTAYLLVQAGKLEQALERLALVQSHSASPQETKERAAKLHKELIAELPPDVVAAAEARGKVRTLEAVVGEILAEKSQDYSSNYRDVERG